LPSARHRGCAPPLVETGDLLVGFGNGCTTISNRPDSFVSYATHRPSWGKLALAFFEHRRCHGFTEQPLNLFGRAEFQREADSQPVRPFPEPLATLSQRSARSRASMSRPWLPPNSRQPTCRI
jgi:hypothetical protein